MPESNKILKLARSSWKMKLYMLLHLPMAFIAGLKIVRIDEMGAEVSVPYKYLNKNPFRSMYFAVQAMAAELSSGILALAEVENSGVAVSMLVLEMKASYLKKARTKIKFVCNDAVNIKKTIEKSIETAEGQTVDVVSQGFDKEGDMVAEFIFTWTFKPKTKHR